MFAFIIRRVIAAVITLFVVSVIVFSLVWVGGDPYAKINQLGNRVSTIDKARLAVQAGLKNYRTCDPGEAPELVGNAPDQACLSTVSGVSQYTKLVFGTGRPGIGYLQGDFGRSFAVNAPTVASEVEERLPASLKLLAAALIVSILFAMPLGIFSALRKYSVFDYTATTASFIGFAMPVFLLALLLQLGALYLQKLNGGELVLATGGRPTSTGIIDVLQHYTLPVFSLAVINIAGWSRYQRSSMLDVLSSDYLRTARAKGLSERKVITGHALRNATLPLITILAIDIAALFSGAVVTERVFGWNGIGSLLVDRIGQSFDPPVVLGIVMIGALMVIVFNALADIAYAVVDPRIRLS